MNTRERQQRRLAVVTVANSEPLDVDAWVRLYVRHILALRGIIVRDIESPPLPQAS